MGRLPCCEKTNTRKGAWTKEEDERLTAYIRAHGEGCWRSLPEAAGLLRCGKSCRLRWMNYLRPDLKRGNFTIEEDELIIKLHSLLGNSLGCTLTEEELLRCVREPSTTKKTTFQVEGQPTCTHECSLPYTVKCNLGCVRWSAIAGRLQGRTDNEIKNHWNSHIRRRLLNQSNHASTVENVQNTCSDNAATRSYTPTATNTQQQLKNKSCSGLNLDLQISPPRQPEMTKACFSCRLGLLNSKECSCSHY